MRIFVTGTEGYLGSLLAPELVRRGYEVIGLDTGYYKERMLYRDGGGTPLTLAKDLREVEAEDLKGRLALAEHASKESEAGVLPDQRLFAEMGKFNEEVVKAGVMVAGEGLQPTSKGARLSFSGGR